MRSSEPTRCEEVTRVSSLMSPNPISVLGDASVREVLAIMALRRIRHVLVVGPDRRLLGLATHRDLTVATADGSLVVQPGLADRPVESVMRRQVATVGPGCCTGEAARYMFRTKRGCLPVVDDERRPVGILTEADFLREFMRATPGCGCVVADDEFPRPSRIPA